MVVNDFSFPTPEYESDGVHLTPYSGLEYLIHLFDSAKVLMSASTRELPDRVSTGDEITRVLQDRVMALEQVQKLMIKDSELKYAIDSELACFQENVRNEVSM